MKIKVIVDFDIFKTENPLRPIYKELGGNWVEIESDWKIFKSAIEQKKPELQKKDLENEISKIFTSMDGDIVSQKAIDDIKGKLKKASPWAYAKETGRAFIPSGEQTQAYERVQAKLKDIGLFVIETGELESFVKSVGGHGPKWITKVMTKNLKTDPELKPARNFIKRVIE